MAKKGMSPEKARMLRESKGLEETRLQKIRVNRGLSQNDLAVRAGISKQSIQLYEQRVRQIEGVSLKRLCIIARTLNCKISDIIEDEQLVKEYMLVK